MTDLDFEKDVKMQEAIRRSGKTFVLMGIVDVITFSFLIGIFYILEINEIPLILLVIPIIAAFGLIIWGVRRMKGPGTRSI